MKKFGFIARVITPLLVLMFFGLLLLTNDHVSAFNEDLQQFEKEGQEEIQSPPPPFSEDMFPCSECHADLETNPERREMEEFHDDIEFNHDEKNRWCLDCHDAANRDMLHSAGGELIDYRESYKLCAQCHGPKTRDWRAGIHGRRIGNWNGKKEYLLCAHCHDPHSPRFKSMKPDPAPRKPEKIK